MVEQIQLAHIPPELALYLAYYEDVQNASFLRNQLLSGNTKFEYAFIDASMVISKKHVLAAAFRAMNDYSHDRLKSRNIHSEIVFALSPNNNIGEAFRRFGVQETTTSLVVLKVATHPGVTLDSVRSHLTSSIHGKEIPFEDASLLQISDIDRIKKVYKISSKQAVVGRKAGNIVNGDSATETNERKFVETQVMGVLALRGAT